MGVIACALENINQHDQIPYIRFGRIGGDTGKHNWEDPKYQQLLDAYADQTIHGTRTLDEFYYYTAGDGKLEKDIKRRNQDQVVTKELDGDVEKRGLESWTVLRIDELWAWVIGKGELQVNTAWADWFHTGGLSPSSPMKVS